MFAVPGWSVSASKLKVQEEPKPKDAIDESNSNGRPAAEETTSKKRKRAHCKTGGTNVTKDNVAALWEKYIEGKASTQPDGTDINPEKSRQKKKRRKEKTNGSSAASTAEGVQDASQVDAVPREAISERSVSIKPAKPSISSSSDVQAGKSKYEQRRTKAEQKALQRKSRALPSPPPPIDTSTKTTSPPLPAFLPTTVAPHPAPPPPSTKFTPLQTAMRAKLISARFRHINQTLYTTPSTYASSLFSTNPEAFTSYHAGFRAQVSSWPQIPVELIMQEIKSRGAVSGPKSQKQLWREEKKKGGKGGGKKKNGLEKQPVETRAENGLKIDPLPRSSKTGISTIVDLGCGDASLHAALHPHISPLNLSIHSYDLSRGDGPNTQLITVSDIAHLPLADSSVDIAIFCLALMGSNWVEFVAEAARVVRVGGECWVVEVRSRFVGAKEVPKAQAGKGGKAEKKKKKAATEEDEMPNTRIEVEEEEIAGKKIREPETDVGPFVEVFRRRGFALKGDVDIGNKMFLRMRFVRVRDAALEGAVKERQAKQHGTSKFIDKEDEMAIDPEYEAKVLKPCLYKTR
ncbi:MAG: hypothetical protein LQ343_004501 [Gyalolechia ehrenbergii]|nr:MAG: hypothetical protein LQ343_004501 [Gyalolechia ehrenbergii]